MIAALAGLPARDAAALKIFLGMAYKGCTVVQAPATPGLALPRADVCIVDLAAMGLSQWSPKAEADLLLCLGGQHALLLGAVGNASWQDKVHATGRHGAQRLAYLAKPYGRDAMREALDSLGLGSGPAPEASPAPVSVSVLSDVAPPLPSAFASLQAVRTLFPDLQRHALLGKLLDLLATGQPHELRITLHQALIVHPRQGWVAHNTSPDVLARLAQHGQTAIGMNARALDSEDDIQRRLVHMTARENLDTFFWRLAQESMGQGTPAPLPTRDAELRLVCMPGFTRIAGADDLALQLAAICLRLPQTLSLLRAAFPEAEPGAIERFMLLATVCGAGRLRLLDAPPRARHKVRTERRAAPRAPQPHRSFFRAMLQKLF
jgi:hypothetical protein